jgi:hypothetical protein
MKLRSSRVLTPSKPPTPSMDHQDTPALEAHNLLFLCLLYSCQGLPMGLIFGSLPLLLQSKMTYAGLAIFSLASYPYTFKLLWSPLVDSIFIKSNLIIIIIIIIFFFFFY